jgi:hypothetical protein
MSKGIKTGGRQKGTANKLTQSMREIVSDILKSELESIKETLESVEPKERLAFIVKLLPYSMPQYTSITYENKEGEKKERSVFDDTLDHFRELTENLRKANA